MVASVRGLMGMDASLARIDFSRIPVTGEYSLSFFLLSDRMSLFNCDQQLPLRSEVDA
jgi:hypothetical protein